MKKFKLMTSLSSIGVLASLTPFLATSCSGTVNNNIDLQDNIAYNSSMTYNGITYELDENIDPNVFTTSWYGFDVITQHIPLKDGGYVTIDRWDELTSLKLLSCSQYATSIGHYFLSFCNSLTELDLSGLNNVTSIGSNFLSSCYSLELLDLSKMSKINYIGSCFLAYDSGLSLLRLPNKSPDSISVSPADFLLYVPTNTTIICDSYLSLYKTLAPWSSRASQMHDYNCSPNLHWENDFMTSDTDKIPCDCNTTAKLHLYDNGSEVTSGVSWKIEGQIIKQLNLKCYENIVTINPTSEAVNADRSLVISAYVNDLLVFKSNYELNEFTNNTLVVYDGKQYELNDNINPNSFQVNDLTTQTLQLKNGESLILNSINWTKLQKIRFNSCDPIVTSLDDYFLNGCSNLVELDLFGLKNITKIGKNFLYLCGSLTSVDLSQLTNVQEIESSFLSECTKLDEIFIPGKSAETFTTSSIDFMKNVPENTHIYCGSGYIVNYITHRDIYGRTSPWSTRNDYLFKDKYEITFGGWNPRIVGINEQSQNQVSLLCDEKKIETSSNIKYVICDGTSSCLNATITNDTITIHPTSYDIPSGQNWNINVDAYLDGKFVACGSVGFNDLMVFSNIIHTGFSWNYYILNTDINPNVFCPSENRDDKFPLPWGEDEVIKNIDKMYYVRITSCDPTVSEIQNGFLSKFNELRWANLSGLGTEGLTKIDAHFLKGCRKLEILTLPDKNPKTFSITSWLAQPLMEDVPKTCVIHCGRWLNEYKTTSPWNRFANQMVY